MRTDLSQLVLAALGAGRDARETVPSEIGPAWRMAGPGILDEFLEVDSEQDGPVDQQVTFGFGDLASRSPRAELAARML